jgi:glutamine amidotransferase
MQWNRLDIVDPDEPMLRHLGDEPYLYFVHSLHGVPDDASMVAATVEYGSTINAAFRRDNVFAVQFHPEKSSRPGLRLLANFVEVCR